MAIETNILTHQSQQSAWLPEWWEVIQKKRESADTVSLSFVIPDGYTALPGQFNMLFVPGIGEIPISISNLDPEKLTLVHTIRNVGAVSKALCDLKKGQYAGVRGPFGTAWPCHFTSGDLVIVAGGIGLAPLRPAILHYLSAKNFSGRLLVLYGVRSPKDILFPAWVRQLGANKNVHFMMSIDQPVPDWKGHIGFVTSFIEHLKIDPASTNAMLCGPDIMMQNATRELIERGVPGKSIYLSLERNMKCAFGQCGHCQLGPYFVCKDGPVFNYSGIERWNAVREL